MSTPVQRYELIQHTSGMQTWDEIEPRPDGDYVKFEDYEKAMAEAADELAKLKRWKEEQLTVESWWSEVDAAVRNHPETRLGQTISHAALALIKERDEFKKLSEETIALVEKCQSLYRRPQV